MLKNVTKTEMMAEASARRERVRAMIQESPPPSIKRIAAREGMGVKPVKEMIEDLGEVGQRYLNMSIRSPKDEVPYGLTPSTANLRLKLGDLVYLVRSRGQHKGANSLGPRLGLNFQEQVKAESAPFNHDWKLSQIERLARELGRDPRELLISCLTG